jgi:CRAL/TRIO domain
VRSYSPKSPIPIDDTRQKTTEWFFAVLDDKAAASRTVVRFAEHSGSYLYSIQAVMIQSRAAVVVAKALESQCPTATASECERFANAHRGEKVAAAKLRQYLEWKDHAETMLQRYSSSDGCCVWEQCMRAAFADFSGHESSSTPAMESLPTCAFHPILMTPAPAHKKDDASPSSATTASATNGASVNADNNNNNNNNDDHHRSVLYVLPARMDFDMIPSDLYTKAMAYFCLKIYNGCDPCTVLIDVRAGPPSWPNMSVTRMQAWVRNCCHTIYSYFPGGLHQVVLYPIPTWAISVWRIITVLLPTDVVASVVLLSGQNTTDQAPYPTGLHSYVAASVICELEEARQASFVVYQS